jgi:3'-phosphoadenosine 5'-phosphosulfate sulfotransferase (PAPS reductase)/FAD synthetase
LCKIFREKKITPPLITKFKRTGCWLCPKQSKESLKNLYLFYPKLWEKLKQYEKDSPHGFKPNFSLKKFELKIKKELKEKNGNIKNKK